MSRYKNKTTTIMNKLIIIDLDIDKGSDQNNNFDVNIGGAERNIKDFTYGDIINLLIKAQKIRYDDPKINLACKINSKTINENTEIYRILSSVYDHIFLPHDKYIKKGIIKKRYDNIKKIKLNDVGEHDTLFDDDYEYDQIKQQLGPILKNHFMFKEHDIEIKLRGGFDFNKHKIKFKKKSNPKSKIICDLYEIQCKMIRQDHIRYYHTNKNTKFHPYNINPMFDNIDEYDYITPLNTLAKYHSENNYYSNLLNRNLQHLEEASEKRIRLNLMDVISHDDRDSIMLQYIKCRRNTFAVTLWKPGMQALDKLVNLLEKEGEVYYIKTIRLTKVGLKNLMFWYYDDFSNESSLKFIEKKLEYVDAVDDNNPVCLIIFDNTQNKNLSGQGSQFKRYLRQFVLDSINANKEKYRGNDVMHINDYFYQTIEYSQLILNDNSIDVLNNQSCQNYLLNGFGLANLKMQTLRSVLYSNLSLLEMDRFIAMGGSLFYAYGVRAFNDIDAIVIGTEPNDSTHLISLIERYFSNKSTKFYFLDAGIQGSSMWNESWSNKDKKILDFLNIVDFKDLALDPKNFFYFQGIKLVTLKYEMLRKLIRNRTEDHVDFMMINLLYPQIIQDFVTLKPYDTSEHSPEPYFIIAPNYTSIAGKFEDKFPKSKDKILKRRYTEEQIDSVSGDQNFERFFNTNAVGIGKS